MSMSESGPKFYDDVYYFYRTERIKGKIKSIKVRVRIGDQTTNGRIPIQRIRDGYISSITSMKILTTE